MGYEQEADVVCHGNVYSAPLSRLPLGQQQGQPALLDYALAGPGTEAELFWELAMGDHAWLEVRLQVRTFRTRRRPKSTWTPTSTEGCTEFIALNLPQRFRTWEEATSLQSARAETTQKPASAQEKLGLWYAAWCA